MNNYYLVLFVNSLDKNKITEILNLEGSIGFCSLVYRPEFKYDFNELLEYVKDINKKYPWKLHEITIEDYPITECIDIALDTNVRKNNTTHYIVFTNYTILNNEFIKLVDQIYTENPKIDAIIPHNDSNNGFVTSFSNHMILNKNNQEPLVQKLIDNDKKIYTI